MIMDRLVNALKTTEERSFGRKEIKLKEEHTHIFSLFFNFYDSHKVKIYGEK